MQTTDNAKNGKSGFTLVELCVVLALLAILVAMVASFSVLMNGFAADNKVEYAFLEDCSKIENELTEWARYNDTEDSTFVVGADGTLHISRAGTETEVAFSDGVLSFGTKQKNGLNAVDGLHFSTNDTLIKCTIFRYDENGNRMESSFVFSLRSGTIQGEEVVDEE